MKHQLEEAFFDGIRRDIRMRHLMLLSVQFLNNFCDLPLFTSLVLSNNRWNFSANFADNNQVLFNNEPFLKVENLLQITSYKAPVKQISPKLSTHLLLSLLVRAGFCYCDRQEHKMCYIQKHGVQIAVRGII